MQCILTALKAESQPLIDHFNLKREPSFDFPVFKNKDIYLLGIGIGSAKIRNRILFFLEQLHPKFIQFINIGIAGGNPLTTKIGTGYVIQKITDKQTGKSFYPEMIIKHKFQESSIVTVNEPVTKDDNEYSTLVDMEASEIFNVLASILPIQRVSFIKIVSDYMDLAENRITDQTISKLIKSRMNLIEHFILEFKRLAVSEKSILNEKDMVWIESIREKFGFTESQFRKLLNYCKGFRLRNQHSNFPLIQLKKSMSKIERNQLFEFIREQLST